MKQWGWMLSMKDGYINNTQDANHCTKSCAFCMTAAAYVTTVISMRRRQFPENIILIDSCQGVCSTCRTNRIPLASHCQPWSPQPYSHGHGGEWDPFFRNTEPCMVTSLRSAKDVGQNGQRLTVKLALLSRFPMKVARLCIFPCTREDCRLQPLNTFKHLINCCKLIVLRSQ